MSFSFRDKPRLSDRLRGKSGDELINEFKEKFDQDRKMFFDSSPSWGSSPTTGPFSRSGFPFDDDMLPRGRQDIRSHLDDLAQRHPEFADHLRYPPWAGDLGSSRGTWGRKRRGSGSGSVDDDARSSSSSEQPVPDSTTTEQTEEPGPLRGRSRQGGNLPQYGLRNTVDLGQQQHEAAEQDKQGRGQRSMSAPPDNRAAPQRFVSRVEINPVNPADPTSGGGPTTVTSEGGQGKPPVAPKQQPGSNVRHIPIFVEGRDEPILPKTKGPENVEQMFTSRPGTEHSFGRPPPHFATPHEFYPQQPQARAKTFQQQQAAPPQSPKQQTAAPQPPKQQTAAPQPPKQQTAAPQPPKQQTPPPQPQEPPKPPANDPISRVHAVQRDVESLQSQVENYTGSSRKDKGYVYLDEMLTRNLLKLDDIETEGKDNVRQARKDAIRSIQRCISVLEGKVPNPDENKEVAMEASKSAAAAEEQSMEVTSQTEAEVPPQQQQSEAEVPSEEAKEEEQKMEVTSQSGNVTDQQTSAVNEQVSMEVDEQKQAASKPAAEPKKKKGGKKSVGKKDSKTADASAVPVSDSKTTEPQPDAS